MIREPVKRAVSQFVHDLNKIIKKNFNNKKYQNVEKYFNTLILNKNGKIRNPPNHYLVTHGMYVVHYKQDYHYAM